MWGGIQTASLAQTEPYGAGEHGSTPGPRRSCREWSHSSSPGAGDGGGTANTKTDALLAITCAVGGEGPFFCSPYLSETRGYDK